MLTFFLDYKSKTPLYEQLYNFIKKAIESDELKRDEKLPSKKKLAQHLKISVITVENAYTQLLAEGYIRSVAKSGYFVQELIKLNPIGKKVDKQNLPKIKAKTDYLVDFRTNQVDTASFPYDKMAKIEKEITLYSYPDKLNDTDFQGLYSLRKQIAELLFSYRGISTRPEQIVIGSGSEHLVSLLILLIGRNNTYGVEEPGYLKNYHLYHDYGAKATTLTMDKQGVSVNGLSNIDVLHVTPSHQFPLGTVTSINRRMELLKWVYEQNNRYIIEDDYDSEFRFSGIPIPAMKSLDQGDRVIYMNSFSKSIAPTLRVSFMVLPDDLMLKYRQSYTYFSCSVPVATQLWLERFISSLEYEKHLNRMKLIYKNKRDYLINKLANMILAENIEIIGEESGLHFLLKLKTNKPIKSFVEAAKKVGVRVYGIDEYYLDKNPKIDEKTIVIGYSHLCESDFDRAIEYLEKAWMKLFS